MLLMTHLLLVSMKVAPVSSFVQPSSQTIVAKIGRITQDSSTTSAEMGSKSEVNDEIAKQLERAKAALAVSRAKMEAQEQAEAGLIDEEEKEEKDEDKAAVPFFAMNAVDENGKKDKVIKDKNEGGGFTTDGDLMAKLSEEEEWESRPLLEVFQNEKEETPEAMGIDRDIGQSMYNLRKSLQTEDFHKIFDKRNRFIGEP